MENLSLPDILGDSIRGTVSRVAVLVMVMMSILTVITLG
jgi:hypothetical protein